MARIRREAEVKRDEGRSDYSFLKLLDVLGVSFEEPEYHPRPLRPGAYKVFAKERAGQADYLREIAMMLENQGYLDDALAVIGYASRKRPDGKGIARIKSRIEEKVNVNRGSSRASSNETEPE